MSGPTGTGWTPALMPSLDGAVAVVTGANSGIGFHAALELARHGARVVLACRDPRRGDEALGQARVLAPWTDVQLSALDLADLASVRAFAAGLGERLDLLVNNAGVMAVPRRVTEAASSCSWRRTTSATSRSPGCCCRRCGAARWRTGRPGWSRSPAGRTGWVAWTGPT